jgi:hypothetical protein
VTRTNGKEMAMDARLDYLGSPVALKVVKHINSAGAVLHDSALPAATQELVKLRASQITAAASAPTCTSRTPGTRGKASSG